MPVVVDSGSKRSYVLRKLGIHVGSYIDRGAPSVVIVGCVVVSTALCFTRRVWRVEI